MSAPAADSPLGRLIHAPMRPGRLDWIGLRPARRAPMLSASEAVLHSEEGLVGDRYRGGSGERHVTLIGAENLVAIASFLGLDSVPPEALRRNLVVGGLNLLALKGRRFRIGEAVLDCTGECHPCSRMEETFGVGGYNAVRGQGGITARVLVGGAIRLGDTVAAEA